MYSDLGTTTQQCLKNEKHRWNNLYNYIVAKNPNMGNVIKIVKFCFLFMIQDISISEKEYDAGHECCFKTQFLTTVLEG